MSLINLNIHDMNCNLNSSNQTRLCDSMLTFSLCLFGDARIRVVYKHIYNAMAMDRAMRLQTVLELFKNRFLTES